ncbi:hypothetical protein LTR62_003044 [Meristemomyces frigidus]|uniref:Amino-acid acetyltransferase, mitochondrial n=1 Tax=Meristemomyces frigidus TaxID=1508187 RepID=A0AAN7TJY3_9PEZI|nr:hypothetical protein LTR62_003044 [Meristemomyces frigidus]
MDVLSANATRRDAKQYLARFLPSKLKAKRELNAAPTARLCRDQERLDKIGVNLGGLYAPSRAIANSAQFVRDEHLPQVEKTAAQQVMHVALVCLRAPESLDDALIDGLATTLSQLVKLDMRIIVVLELASNSSGVTSLEYRAEYATQAERLRHAINKHSEQAACFVTSALQALDDTPSEVEVFVPELIMGPLKRNMVPILPPFAYTAIAQLKQVDVGSVMLGLTRMVSSKAADVDTEPRNPSIKTLLDRIIVLDQAGGIPSRRRSDNAHIFINLAQEFDGIYNELSRYAAWDDTVSRPNMFDQHQANLKMLRECLEILPAESSGLIISPQEAATSSQATQPQATTIGTGTRRQKNTLIHNLLTNKPMVSSSLPAARISSPPNPNSASSAATATLVKRGMPVTILPTPHRTHAWQPPTNGISDLDLQTHPGINFPRLVNLIEASFRRKLDVEHYMSRIRHRTAGVIIAGDYEGAAILTWEQPPSPDGRLVPYLDKFAVAPSSQGSSGVADVLFQSLVRSCFPHGFCWRSRRDNPVNKWYFERCAGSWSIPDTQWTLFWTGEEGVVEDVGGRWGDYVGVCERVGPSWGDGGRVG